MQKVYIPLISLLAVLSAIFTVGCTHEESEISLLAPKGYSAPQALYRRTWQENVAAFQSAPSEPVASKKPSPVKLVTVAPKAVTRSVSVRIKASKHRGASHGAKYRPVNFTIVKR